MTLTIENSHYGYDLVIDGVRVDAEALLSIIRPSPEVWLRFTRVGNEVKVDVRPND